MKRIIITTKDGSHTLFVPELNEHYHSIHGAIQESRHVFINNGLNAHPKNFISILEVGFGTGLNTYLTALEKKIVNYHTIELHPLSLDEVKQLNYTLFLDQKKIFEEIHHCEWEKNIIINKYFSLKKTKTDIRFFNLSIKYDVVFFDAFAPEVQPDLWEKSIFKKLYSNMNDKGMLVTYCAKGIVKRRLIDVGFQVEKLTGPPGKREMIRARKLISNK